MELETNTQADGVDVITRVTKTREEIQSELESAQRDIQLVLDRVSQLQELTDKLPTL